MRSCLLVLELMLASFFKFLWILSSNFYILLGIYPTLELLHMFIVAVQDAHLNFEKLLHWRIRSTNVILHIKLGNKGKDSHYNVIEGSQISNPISWYWVLINVLSNCLMTSEDSVYSSWLQFLVFHCCSKYLLDN